MKPARTRFAPSPTGYQHVGGIRTALFAWLLARQSGGQFILRLEDTDKTREVEGSGQHIIESLRWLGLDWDEGLEVGGGYGPYCQSERLATYQEWAQRLIDKGRAYADPFTPEEVEQFRAQSKAEKRPFLFRDHRPTQPPKWEPGMALRFKSEPKTYEWHDLVLGDLHAGPEAIDDFIILKADGYPTYNFAHIIDDHLMQCTHVIRSQEFTSSVPKYLNVYEALGIERPLLATVPFVMGPDGKKKLSKRDGAKDVLDYAREGFLPDTLVNFMALLGWHDGSTQEIFSREELVQKFNLADVGKGGARFDEQRLLWMNGHYIRQLPPRDLAKHAQNHWPADADTYSDEYKMSVLLLVQERLKFFGELPGLTEFFFKDLPVNTQLISSDKKLKKIDTAQLNQWLRLSRDRLSRSDFSAADLTTKLNRLLEETGQKPAMLFSLIRIATTGAPASPGLAETMAVLGRGASLRRIDAYLEKL